MSRTTSLNGGQTHPLTPHARAVLVRLVYGPQPVNPTAAEAGSGATRINPGVVDRLTRAPALATLARHTLGRKYLTITEAGRAYLAETARDHEGEAP